MMWCVYNSKTGIISWIGNMIPRKGLELGESGVVVPIPDQNIYVVDREEAQGLSGEIVVGASRYPDDVPEVYTQAEITAVKSEAIDRDTSVAIDEVLHPVAGIGEQLGILRYAITELYNRLGEALPEELAHFNDVANAAIQEGTQKKEALK